MEASKENNENEDEQFLLLSNNQTNDDTINLDTDKSEENSNSKYEKDSDLDSDLNELMKLANNKVNFFKSKILSIHLENENLLLRSCITDIFERSFSFIYSF